MLLVACLYGRDLDVDLCDALRKRLKVDTDLTRSSSILTGKYHIHKWNVFVPDREKTTRAMTKFSKEYDVGLTLDPLVAPPTDRSDIGLLDVTYAILRVMHLTRFIPN